MRRLLFLACAVVFLDVTFFSVLTPLLPEYRDDLGLSDGSAGLLSGSFAAGTLVMAMPAGWLAARFGSRRTVMTGLVGIGIFSPLFGFADHILVLDVCRFFQGASGALMWAGSMSWVITSAPRAERGRMIGTVLAAAVVGELMGAPLGAVAHHVGTEAVFGSVLVFAAALFMLAATIEPSAEVARQPVREAIAVTRRSNVPSAVLMLAAPSIAFGLMIVVAPLSMDDLGASPFVIAAAFAVGSVVEATVGPLIGRYSDRAGRTGPYLIGMAVLAVAILIVGIFSVLPVIAAAVVLLALGAGLSFTPASSLVSDAATGSGLNQGYASGASNVAWGGGQMIGSIGGGLLAGLSGYLLPCLLTVAILGGVAALANRIVQPLPSESET